MAEQKLKNAHSLKELLSSMTVPEDHELVSFDVKSPLYLWTSPEKVFKKPLKVNLFY